MKETEAKTKLALEKTSQWPMPDALFINLETMRAECLNPDEIDPETHVLVSDLLAN